MTQDPNEIFGLELKPSDFYNSRHSGIFQSILSLVSENKEPSFPAILEYYKKNFGNQNGIASYIAGLADDLVSVNLQQDAALIKEAARQRKLQMFLQGLLQEDWASADEVLGKIQTGILDCQPSKKNRPGITQVCFRLHDQITENKKARRIGHQTGFAFLDKVIEGFIPTHLWIVGAYTSVGKTALMIQLIVNALRQKPGIKIAVFSTEMSSEMIALRLIANRTDVPSMAILRGNSIPGVQQRIDEGFDYFHKKNVWIYDHHYTFESIFLEAKQLKMTDGVDLIFIDYLQNCTGEGSMYERMALLPVQFHKMAKALQVCVVVMSQVSNEAAQSDSEVIGYKGAGEIAAACDLGLWLRRDKNDKYLLMCSIRKNRHGPTGKKELRFSDNFTRIDETD